MFPLNIFYPFTLNKYVRMEIHLIQLFQASFYNSILSLLYYCAFKLYPWITLQQSTQNRGFSTLFFRRSVHLTSLPGYLTSIHFLVNWPTSNPKMTIILNAEINFDGEITPRWRIEQAPPGLQIPCYPYWANWVE